MRIFFLAFLGLCGCAGYPQRFRYNNLPPDLKIIYAGAESVNSHCARDGGTYDDGHKADGSRKIRCCYYTVKHLMIVSYGADDCIAHELCHADGRPAIECDAVHVGGK